MASQDLDDMSSILEEALWGRLAQVDLLLGFVAHQINAEVLKNEKQLRDLGADFRSVHRLDEESV
jgi:hypothetical protein